MTNGEVTNEVLPDNDECVVAGDAKAQALFYELAAEGELRRVGWTDPDEDGRVSPVYEHVPSHGRLQAVLDALERDGIVARSGKMRNGEPVYHVVRFPPRSAGPGPQRGM